MDLDEVKTIEEMAQDFDAGAARFGFKAGANKILDYLKDILKNSFDSEAVGDKVQYLVNKLENNNDYEY